MRDHQHRIEAGDHLSAGRHCLQCQQGRGEGADRSLGAQPAQCRGRADHRASADPGSTFTGMTSRGRTEKPPGAWVPDQVVDMLIDGMQPRRLLYTLPGQRRDARDRQSADRVGGTGHHPEPARAVAMAFRLQRGIRDLSSRPMTRRVMRLMWLPQSEPRPQSGLKFIAMPLMQ